MAVEFVRVGDVITYSNTGSAISKGAVVVMKHTIGIALDDIAATTGVGPVAISGHFKGLPKVTAAVFVQGEKLIWDESEDKFDDSAATPATTDITGACIAAVAGLNGETTCEVILTPGNTTLTP